MKEKIERGRGYLTGIIALVFMIIGYQTALFVHHAAVMKITANRDEPDTVYIYKYPDSQPDRESALTSKSSSAGAGKATNRGAPEVKRKNAASGLSYKEVMEVLAKTGGHGTAVYSDTNIEQVKNQIQSPSN